MDVSIAVSLIRGQMGTVVERAVNGAVETVLAEMLKVVGVKFEELKNQVALMKRDMETLQREKALKDKENDNMRAKLRYTELKLKYYRQGVEEELQQRVSAAALTHNTHNSPSGQVTGQTPGQSGTPGFSQVNAAPSCSGQTRTGTTSTSPQTSGRHSGRGPCQTDVRGATSNPLNVILPLMSTSTESLDNSADVLNQDSSVNNSEDQNLEWAISLQPSTEVGAVSGLQFVSFKPEQQSTTGSSSSEVSAHADSSTLPCSPSQVKQEPQQFDEEVICIKEEPDEEQDGSSVFDCPVQLGQASVSEVTRNGAGWSGPQTGGINAADSSGPNYLLSQLAASMPCSLSGSVSSFTAHQFWPRRAFGFSEELKKHRKDQQRRSWIKCRELEKTLPQPMLSEILRERREKTRLRVAKWRAKKKLQEARARGGAAAASSTMLPGSMSGLQPRPNAVGHIQNNYLCKNPSVASVQPTHPFLGTSPGPSTYSSLYLKVDPGVSAVSGQHTVTSSSSVYPQVNATQQATPLNDPDVCIMTNKDT